MRFRRMKNGLISVSPEYFQRKMIDIINDVPIRRVYRVAGKRYRTIYFDYIREQNMALKSKLEARIKRLEQHCNDIFESVELCVQHKYEQKYANLNQPIQSLVKLYNPHPRILELDEDSDMMADWKAAFSLAIQSINLNVKIGLLAAISVEYNIINLKLLQKVNFLYNCNSIFSDYPKLPFSKEIYRYLPYEIVYNKKFFNTNLYGSLDTRYVTLLPLDSNKIITDCKRTALFFACDFVCDPFSAPDYVNTNMFFIFGCKLLDLINPILFYQILLSHKFGLPYTQINTDIYVIGIITFGTSATNVMQYIDLHPYNLNTSSTYSQTGSSHLSGPTPATLSLLTDLGAEAIKVNQADRQGLQMINHPVLNSVIKQWMPKSLIQDIVSQDGNLYRVTNWGAIAQHTSISMVSIWPEDDPHNISAKSVAPQSVDDGSELVRSHYQLGQFFYGRLCEYFDEMAYLNEHRFADEPDTELPEDYDDLQIVIDPAFYMYERSIRLFLLAALLPQAATLTGLVLNSNLSLPQKIERILMLNSWNSPGPCCASYLTSNTLKSADILEGLETATELTSKNNNKPSGDGDTELKSKRRVRA